jgi:O-antigen/teichoic acid export membrane protein
VASSSYILPSAKALGIWGRVTQFFNVAWLFFDMGTSAAFVKFLAEYRVHDPRRGI